LTIIADCEHQQVNRNAACLLCTLNTVATVFSSQSSTPIASDLSDPAVLQDALQIVNVFEILTIQFLLQSSL